MKKMLIAAVAFGAMGFVNSASATVASNVFQWAGTVPASATQNGFIIKSPTASDIGAGQMTFTADTAGKGVLSGSSTIEFNVFEYSANTVGAAATDFTYQLSSLKAGVSGLAQEQSATGYFQIEADAVPLVKGTDVTKANGGVVSLSVAPTNVATPSNQPAAGDSVEVLATILVSNATI
ncbi:hypothetical protein [Aeromonas veronii]|uniref:hypothetical protein n=1 Tax=Aeromonas veronii TaxID=654 RepID=UPI001012DF66|nr:hypothetical protein [Aeromonas veronii]